jgi:hypothetical protein
MSHIINSDNVKEYIDDSIKNSNNDVDEIIEAVEKNQLSAIEIMRKYNVNAYRFYKILNEYNLVVTKKIKSGPTGPTGPKKTKFKQLLLGTEEEQKAAKILPEGFVLNDFIEDSKNGLKISELRQKYNLTLYHIRELRKKYDLKKR